MSGNFGDLLKQAGFKATETTDAPEPEVASEPEAIVYAPKVVCRLQRKGYGGKTVTVVTGVESGREPLTKLLKKQLGTGVRIDEDALVLQGDQRERAARWFESQGVKKVVRA